MIIRNKFNGYSNDGRRVYPGGGGGGPNYTYSQTSNIPEYAQPYVERMMGATEKQIFNFDDKGDGRSHSRLSDNGSNDLWHVKSPSS